MAGYSHFWLVMIGTSSTDRQINGLVLHQIAADYLPTQINKLKCLLSTLFTDTMLSDSFVHLERLELKQSKRFMIQNQFRRIN